jgi:hypothetical protein
VAESPDHLAEMLAELEARKEALRNRIESLDTAISGIHELQAASPASAAVQPVDPQLIQAEDLNESPIHVLQREQTTEVRPPLESERRDFIRKHDLHNTLAETPKALSRPVQLAPSERRKPDQLNVYVNQNSEWASRQFVAPHSPRAVFRRKAGQRCPKCGSQDTRLTTTRGIADCFMFLFDYSLARCRNCDSRFRIWRSREEGDDPQHDLDQQPNTE